MHNRVGRAWWMLKYALALAYVRVVNLFNPEGRRR